MARYGSPMFQILDTEPADDDDSYISTDDLELLTENVGKLKALVNDPIALMSRAKALLEGTAKPLLMWPFLFSLIRFSFSAGVVSLAGHDIPNFPLDDLARELLEDGWVGRLNLRSLLFGF